MHHAIGEALRDVSSEYGLECVATPHLHELDGWISEASASVALSMYRLARWPALILDALTYYTHEQFPILGEALVGLEQSSDDFFAYEIARISDPDVAEEELMAHLRDFVRSEDELGEDDTFDQ